MGGDALLVVFPANVGISIHAPHTGGDDIEDDEDDEEEISIHAPRVGGDSAP